MYKKILFFFCLIICTYQLVGQDTSNYKNINWRIYHSSNWRNYVDYKSEEWKNMSYKEKNALFQIPDVELLAMSTDELIEVSIDCFFAKDFVMFSSINRYNSLIYNLFNGFRELTERSDVCPKIIRYYKELKVQSEILSPAGLTAKDHVKILEYFIVHPNILVKYNPDELRQLFYSLKEKYAAKETMADIYDEKDMIPNVYALARILEKLDQQTNSKLHNVNNVEQFLDSGRMLTLETRDQILNICNGF